MESPSAPGALRAVAVPRRLVVPVGQRRLGCEHRSLGAGCGRPVGRVLPFGRTPSAVVAVGGCRWGCWPAVIRRGWVVVVVPSPGLVRGFSATTFGVMSGCCFSVSFFLGDVLDVSGFSSGFSSLGCAPSPWSCGSCSAGCAVVVCGYPPGYSSSVAVGVEPYCWGHFLPLGPGGGVPFWG